MLREQCAEHHPAALAAMGAVGPCQAALDVLELRRAANKRRPATRRPTGTAMRACEPAGGHGRRVRGVDHEVWTTRPPSLHLLEVGRLEAAASKQVVGCVDGAQSVPLPLEVDSIDATLCGRRHSPGALVSRRQDRPPLTYEPRRSEWITER